MSAIYFQLNDIQYAELKDLMASEGYTNKAEFFRFLIKFFKYRYRLTDMEKLEKTGAELGKVLSKLKKAGKLDKLKSIDEQLGDL